jgi:cytochrome P450 family 6
LSIDREFYDNSLLTLEGQEWRDRRVKLSPIFTSGKMKTMFETVDMIGNKFIEVIENNLEKNDSLELRDFARKYTSDVIGL